MEEIVDQYWEPCNPYEAQYQAAYVHQATPQDYFFGWVYNEDAEQGYVPLFLSYHIEGPLTDDLLESIFACLQQGPAKLIRPQEPPPQLATLSLETLEKCKAARPGVAVPEDIQQESFSALEQEELLSLFVPSLGVMHAVPLSPASPVSELKRSGAIDRSRLAKAGFVVGGLATAVLGLSVYSFRPSPSLVSTGPPEQDSSAEKKSLETSPRFPLPGSGQAAPGNIVESQPKLGSPTKRQAVDQPSSSQNPQIASRPSPQQNLQAQRSLAASLRRSSQRQAVQRLQQSPAQRQTLARSLGQRSDRSLISSTPSVTVSGVNLDTLLPQRRFPGPSAAVTPVQPRQAIVAPQSPSPPVARDLRPVPPAPVVTLPSPSITAQSAPSPLSDDEASRLAEVATSQQLANVLTRGLVVANRDGDLTYRSGTYLKVQNVIRRLRLGEEWSMAANRSGVSEQMIVALAQQAYDADLDAASIAINKGVTTHDIANAIARGLVIADREGEVRYRSHTYLKVQDVIHRLRLGQNRHFAARQSGVQQALIEKLLVLGGLPPANATVSFNMMFPLKPVG
ncbi:MAG: hypothetical protein WA902_00720 [Thermosynechococcaceae cyanobacterium]